VDRERKVKHLCGSTNGNYHTGQIRNGSWPLHTEWEITEKVQRVCKELRNKRGAITKAVITKKSKWNLQRVKAMFLSGAIRYLWSPEKRNVCPSHSVDFFLFTTALLLAPSGNDSSPSNWFNTGTRGIKPTSVLTWWSDLEIIDTNSSTI